MEGTIGNRINEGNNPIRNPNEEFCTCMNFQDEKGDTLLHQAVMCGNIQAIGALFKYGADPLIKNADDRILLDLDQGEEISKELIKYMKD